MLVSMRVETSPQLCLVPHVHPRLIKMIFRFIMVQPWGRIGPQVRCVRFKNVPEGYTSSLMREELEAPRVGGSSLAARYRLAMPGPSFSEVVTKGAFFSGWRVAAGVPICLK